MPETNVTLLINYTLIHNKKFKKKSEGRAAQAAYPNSIHPVSLSPKPLFSLKPSVLLWLWRSLPSVASAAFFVLLQDLALFFF